jgi:hypothetical protein
MQVHKSTAYTIYHQEGSLRNFSLTLVDTPDVGDTKGLKGTRRHIKDFFSESPPEGGVDHCDAIGCVTIPRTTHSNTALKL